MRSEPHNAFDDLLNRLRLRLDAWTDRGDRQAILGATVAAQLNELIRLGDALSSHDPRRAAGAHLVATMRWQRYKAGSADTMEAMAAMATFQDIYRVNPDFVPSELHQIFEVEPDPQAQAQGEAAAVATVLQAVLEDLEAADTETSFTTHLDKLRLAVAEPLPPGHPQHPYALACLARGLRTGHERWRRAGSLDEAVTIGARALDLAGPDHDNHPACAVEQAATLIVAFRESGERHRVDEAVTLSTETLRRIGPDNPMPPALHTVLGAALMARADRFPSTDDRDEAIASFRAAADDEASGADAVSNLSQALYSRFVASGARPDLDESIEVLREALRWLDQHPPRKDIRDLLWERPPGQPADKTLYRALVARLGDRYDVTGNRADLEEAITHARRSDRATDLVGLGHLMLRWVDDFDDGAMAEEAVAVASRAVEATPSGSPGYAAAHCLLGMALRTRFRYAGDDGDLDEAVECGRTAVATAAEGSADMVTCLTNLSLMLRSRGVVTGSMSDLDEAIVLVGQIGDLVPAGHPFRLQLVLNQAEYLIARNALTSGSDYLDRAIELLAAAWESAPGHGGQRADIAREYGHALLIRDEARPDASRLDLAVKLVTEAMDQPGQTPAAHAKNIIPLAEALTRRARRGAGTTGDLDRAIALLSDATPTPNRSRHASRLSALFEAYAARYAKTAQTPDRTAAAAAFEAAMKVDLPAASQISTVKRWSICCRRDLGAPAGALAAYRILVDLLPQLTGFGLDETDREHHLDGHLGLPGTVMAIAVDAGDTDGALELVERCRSVLWSQRVALRSDLGALRAAAPATAQRLASAGTELRRHEQNPRSGRPRRLAAAEWEAALAETRRVPGFSSFLHSPPAAVLRRAAAAGPIVVVGSVEPRCDALIVRPNEVTPVPLRISMDEFAEHLTALVVATRDGQASPQTERETAVSAALDWLWKTVAEPILDELGYTEPQPDPIRRLWWCPIGAMSLLPLHAAGRHRDGRGATVLDRVVSSYTPTLTTLTRARERAIVADSGSDEFLIITPRAPQLPELAHVSRERDRLAELLGQPRCTVLDGAAATADAVLAALRRHRWFHFAGHGSQSVEQPSQAAMHLSDVALSLADLADAERSDGEFAYLSACDTMASGVRLTDEAMTLAAAVQFAGFRHVIGTLWAVQDRVAATVSNLVYGGLIADGRIRSERSAIALHRAIVTMRDARPDRPSTWANFVHTGP